jgi:hypothetical protein
LLLSCCSTIAAAQEADEPIETPAVAEKPAADDRYGEDGLAEFRRAQRSGALAIAMTIPVPGWGQLYADAPFWSVVGFAVQSWYLGNVLMERRRLERQKAKLQQLRDLRDEQVASGGLASTRVLNSISVREQFVQEHRERARDFLWWGGGAYLLLAFDAFVSVELADFDSPDPPTPDLDRDWRDDTDDGGGVQVSVNFSF